MTGPAEEGLLNAAGFAHPPALQKRLDEDDAAQPNGVQSRRSRGRRHGLPRPTPASTASALGREAYSPRPATTVGTVLSRRLKSWPNVQLSM